LLAVLGILKANGTIRTHLIKHVDLIVLGAGLAGTAVAWNAHWRGWTIAIIDRADSNSSSRVAAGLVTPITGSRAAASWRWSEFYPAANDFYRQVEKRTGARMWHVEPALRLLRSEDEKQLYHSKWMDSGRTAELDSIQVELSLGMEIRGLRTPYAICSFGPSARLETLVYLTESHRYFGCLDAFHGCDLNCDRDIDFAKNVEHPIQVPSLGLAGKRIVFCQGIGARENRFFMELPLHPARGDILMVQSPGVHCDRVLHHNAWAVPIGHQRYLVGATYDRAPNQFDGQPFQDKTPQFRAELMRRWEAMVEGTFSTGEHSVLEQRWAVRPASYDRHPLIGPHDVLPNVFCLNGLGSKGTLMAPRLADMLLEAMQGAPIDPGLLQSRRR